MAHKGRESGFVLLVVLVVLTLAATVLSASARLSSRKVMEAGTALRDLQLRWGARSCREAFLDRAEVLLKQCEAFRSEPVVSMRETVVLGGLRFRLILSDEQAKANVNLLARRVSKETLAARLRALQAAQFEPLPVLLRPSKQDPAQGTRRPSRGSRSRSRRGRRDLPMVYSSLDQVFRYEHPSKLVSRETEDFANSRITCWSDGRLNFKRADVSVLREVLGGVLNETQISRLVEFRERRPDCSLRELLAHLKPSRRRSASLQDSLTENSGCHGLWIVVEGRTRNWYLLYVVRDGDGNAPDPNEWVFQW